MIFLAGALLIVVAFLLGDYYRKNANQDDLNRPSFFNSKARKYFLLVCCVTFVICGASLLLLGGYLIWIFVLTAILYSSYIFVNKERLQNTIIRKTLHNYRVFSQPDISFSKNEVLTAPVTILLLFAKMPKDFCDMASKYLENRLKEGKIKTARDLPQEAWTIIGSTGKAEIKQNPNNVLPQSKIDYYYEEIIEGKEHKNFVKTLLSLLRNAEFYVERMFQNFAFVNLTRPDFSSTEIALARSDELDTGRRNTSENQTIATFPEVNVTAARKFGWVKDHEEYYFLASLEFSRRFPKHKFSREVKKKYKYSNQKILDYAQSWEKPEKDNGEKLF